MADSCPSNVIGLIRKFWEMGCGGYAINSHAWQSVGAPLVQDRNQTKGESLPTTPME